MESCYEAEGYQSPVCRWRENTKLITKLAAKAQIVMSAEPDHEQQLNAESLLQDSEAEFTSTEYEECPRWSLFDSQIPALEEELSSCDLPISDAEPNITFAIEIDSLDSYTSPAGLLDPKFSMRIAYDLDESAGIENCNTNCNSNETFVLKESKGDCNSVPIVHHSASNSAKALTQDIVRTESSYTEQSSGNEAEYYDRGSSDEEGVNMEEKVSSCRSDFEMADGELDTSLSFQLRDDGDISARVTSTPIANYANNNLDTVLPVTVKRVRRLSTEPECPEYVPSARRMLRMCEVDNTTKERVIGSANEKYHSSDFNVLNDSFAVSPLDQYSHVGRKHNETYDIGKLESSAAGDFDGNLSDCIYLTPVKYRERKARKHRVLSSVNKSFRCDSSFVLQRSADERNSLCMNDDFSLSNVDVFKDDDVASFFVTEWPSVLTGDCHDLLLSEFRQQSIPLAQSQDASCPHHIRIVVKSASLSSPDLFTDWSFQSLVGQAYPSFDGSSVNELDQVSLHQYSSTRCLSYVTNLSELDEEMQQLNSARKYR